MAMPDSLAPMLAAVEDEEKGNSSDAGGEDSALLRKVSKSVADAGL